MESSKVKRLKRVTKIWSKKKFRSIYRSQIYLIKLNSLLDSGILKRNLIVSSEWSTTCQTKLMSSTQDKKRFQLALKHPKMQVHVSFLFRRQLADQGVEIQWANVLNSLMMNLKNWRLSLQRWVMSLMSVRRSISSISLQSNL